MVNPAPHHPATDSSTADGTSSAMEQKAPQRVQLYPGGPFYQLEPVLHILTKTRGGEGGRTITCAGRRGERGMEDGSSIESLMDTPTAITVRPPRWTPPLPSPRSTARCGLWQRPPPSTPPSLPLPAHSQSLRCGAAQLSADGKRLHVADSGNGVLRVLDLASDTLSTVRRPVPDRRPPAPRQGFTTANRAPRGPP
jgi:hypothetical protein